MAVEDASFAYHEPDIQTVLILTGFLLVLNFSRYILDKLVYCGLLGQILVGVLFGTPGAKWLSTAMESTIQQLGYLGLLLLVYEGGLSTSVKTLKANLLLSTVVAITGIGVPIALSFVLPSLLDITALQAFAAGAALCSTSLGTTFTVLSTSGLSESRLGVVLTSAAMMDDVVGLVMVQVISALGAAHESFSPVTVIRPAFVSVAFAVIIPLVCTKLVAPCGRLLQRSSSSGRLVWLHRQLARDNTRFVLQTLLLVMMVTGATYAGTSGLFAAYIAGACITWFDDLNMISAPSTLQASNSSVSPREHCESHPGATSNTRSNPVSLDREQPHDVPSRPDEQGQQETPSSGFRIYESYYKPSVDNILIPLFFASIGFSIPITQMFSGSIVWRGLVYTVLMAFGKFVCGMWLIRLPSVIPRATSNESTIGLRAIFTCWHRLRRRDARRSDMNAPSNDVAAETTTAASVSNEMTVAPAVDGKETDHANNKEPTTPKKCSLATQPLSLYPAALLGGAMVARGEIGFLISSVAESSGIFTHELFLVVTWAIFLCTFAGPLVVGSLVRRVKSYQKGERRRDSGKQDPLGISGVSGIKL